MSMRPFFSLTPRTSRSLTFGEGSNDATDGLDPRTAQLLHELEHIERLIEETRPSKRGVLLTTVFTVGVLSFLHAFGFGWITVGVVALVLGASYSLPFITLRDLNERRRRWLEKWDELEE